MITRKRSRQSRRRFILRWNSLHDISAYGIYWDDIQQRLFYRTLKGSKTKTHETTAALLPPWGGIGINEVASERLAANEPSATLLPD